MSEPHTIRLREPWERHLQGENVHWRRAFNRPTGLSPGVRVELVVDGADQLFAAHLNAVPIAGDDAEGPSRRFLITEAMLVRNQLEIIVQGEGPIEVRLEIFEPVCP